MLVYTVHLYTEHKTSFSDHVCQKKLQITMIQGCRLPGDLLNKEGISSKVIQNTPEVEKCLIALRGSKAKRSYENTFWCCQSLPGASWLLLTFRLLSTNTLMSLCQAALQSFPQVSSIAHLGYFVMTEIENLVLNFVEPDRIGLSQL